MDFSLNDDHLEMREAVRRFMEGEYPAQQRGDPETGEIAAERWKGMAALGLLGLPFAVEHGGSGQGPVEVMLASGEMGRVLGGGAFVPCVVLAGGLLGRTASAGQMRRWMPDLASGRLSITAALYEENARYDWWRVSTHAREIPGGYSITGRKTLVLHGDRADWILLLARTSGDTADRAGLSLFAIQATAPGVKVMSFDTLDGRRAAHVEFTNVEVAADSVLGDIGTAAGHVEGALDAACAALCAEAVGAIDTLISLTAEHLRTRHQFGSPLAKFQALQHRLADMAIAREQLDSMACAAAMAVEADCVPAVGAGNGNEASDVGIETSSKTRRRLVSAAKVLTGQLGRQVGASAIQMHGGMGMTDECRVGHYAKRLLVIGQLFGDAAFHLDRMQKQ